MVSGLLTHSALYLNDVPHNMNRIKPYPLADLVLRCTHAIYRSSMVLPIIRIEMMSDQESQWAITILDFALQLRARTTIQSIDVVSDGPAESPRPVGCLDCMQMTKKCK